METKKIMEVFDARMEQLNVRLKNKKLSPKARLIWQSAVDELTAIKQLIRTLKD